jgi:NAD-dependent deacetylase
VPRRAMCGQHATPILRRATALIGGPVAPLSCTGHTKTMELASYRDIVVLTGAGISRSAGLATYRGPGGLWTDPELEELAHVDALQTRRAAVCGMFWTFERAIRQVAPTAAHRALATFEAALAPGARFLIVTQNVDGLHQAAGSRQVCEYHGTLRRWRCERCGIEREPPDGDPPVCCGELMRPAAVLFGEMIPVEAERIAKHALRSCDLFVAIGTSGTVYPAAGFVRAAGYAGARTVLLNLEIDDDARADYAECRAGAADDLVPELFA